MASPRLARVVGDSRLLKALESRGVQSIFDIVTEDDEVIKALLADVLVAEDSAISAEEALSAVTRIVSLRDGLRVGTALAVGPKLGSAAAPIGAASSSSGVEFQDPQDIRAKRSRVEQYPEQERHGVLVNLLLAECLKFRSMSTHLQQVRTGEELEGLLTSLRVEWEEVPLDLLKHYYNALQRYKDKATEQHFDYIQPTVIQVAAHIASTRLDPAHELAAMAWIEKAFGVTLHAGTALVKRQVKAAFRPPPRQAWPPGIATMLALEYHSASSNVYVADIAAIGSFLGSGSTRLAHAQRSKFVRADPWFVEFLASRGKSKVGGIRRPFTWTAPRHGLGGTDLFRPLERVIQLLMASHPEVEVEPSYMVPDFAPERADLKDVSGFYPRPMSNARLFAYLKKIILSVVPTHSEETVKMLEEDVEKLTGRSFRHFLPTLPQREMYTTQEQLALGLYVDEHSKLARQLAMPRRYSSEKMFTRALGKTTLMRSLRSALLKYQEQFQELAYTESREVLSILARRVPTLDQLVAYWPARTLADEEAALWIRIKNDERVELEAHVQEVQIEDGMLQWTIKDNDVEDEVRGDGSSGESSHSDSSSSGESTDVEDMRFLHTTRGDGKLHILSRALDEGETACGRHLCRPVYIDGIARATESPRQWSPRCWAKLSERARATARRHET